MITYTVTEDKARGIGWLLLCDGKRILRFQHKENAEVERRSLTLHDRAEAMLDLLVETLAENRDEVFPHWEARRDALIAQINGEATCGRCGKPFAPFEIAPAFLGLKPVMSAICPECTAKRQAKTEAEER